MDKFFKVKDHTLILLRMDVLPALIVFPSVTLKLSNTEYHSVTHKSDRAVRSIVYWYGAV